MTRSLGPVLAAATFVVGTVPARAEDPPQVTVTITDKGCEPAALTAVAGKTVFLIKNTSSRKIEWEILNGVMVVEERENIVPGFVQKLTATLDSGSYGMTCGLLSNPKGTLTVTAKSGALSISPSSELARALLPLPGEGGARRASDGVCSARDYPIRPGLRRSTFPWEGKEGPHLFVKALPSEALNG